MLKEKNKNSREAKINGREGEPKKEKEYLKQAKTWAQALLKEFQSSEREKGGRGSLSRLLLSQHKVNPVKRRWGKERGGRPKRRKKKKQQNCPRIGATKPFPKRKPFEGREEKHSRSRHQKAF